MPEVVRENGPVPEIEFIDLIDKAVEKENGTISIPDGQTYLTVDMAPYEAVIKYFMENVYPNVQLKKLVRVKLELSRLADQIYYPESHDSPPPLARCIPPSTGPSKESTSTRLHHNTACDIWERPNEGEHKVGGRTLDLFGREQLPRTSWGGKALVCEPWV
jgi:hypothetical protein